MHALIDLVWLTKLKPIAARETAALGQQNSTVISLHSTHGSPQLLHVFWPNIITFGTSKSIQAGCTGLGGAYNSDFLSKLGLKPVIFARSIAANALKCSWSSNNFPTICPKGHACSKTVTINLGEGEN